MDPHSTQKKGRSCPECHQSPKTVGLGPGNIGFEGGKIRFWPAETGVDLGLNHSLQALVDVRGRPLTNLSRPNLRPFNQEEIYRILRVGLCLPCHQDYHDPVMKNWRPDLSCPVFDEKTGP
ncbi:hypothetical protein [Thermosulfuriphilus sp.]